MKRIPRHIGIIPDGNHLGRDKLNEQCLLTRIVRALDRRDYETASSLQVEMQEKVKELTDLYIIYKKNLF